jgi:hypothetical protein
MLRVLNDRKCHFDLLGRCITNVIPSVRFQFLLTSLTSIRDKCEEILVCACTSTCVTINECKIDIVLM